MLSEKEIVTKDNILSLFKKLQFDDNIYSISNDEITVYISNLWGINLHLLLNNESVQYYFVVRTSSWVYDGERSDLHDVISVCLALFLKQEPVYTSYSIQNIYNPVTDDDYEMYGRVLLPIQGKNILYTIASIEDLIIFSDAFCHIFLFMYGHNIPSHKKCDINLSKSFLLKIGTLPNNIDIKKRNFPKWEYYRDYDKRLSIIKSPMILSYISNVFELLEKLQSIEGIESIMFFNDKYNHSIKKNEIDFLKETMKSLNDNVHNFVFLENIVITTGEKYILFGEVNCGIDTYKSEKNILKERHDKEYELLFRPNRISLAHVIDGNLFEMFILDLLRRNVNIHWIRKVSHTNESDGGRDFIAEIDTPATQSDVIYKDKVPFIRRRIIVQCKAYKNGLAKKDVIDIRDTIEHYNAQGYFLIISSYIKRSLTEHLEKLRYESGFYVDWWGKEELENELLRNKDLIDKYPKIITFEK
ncbi:MAG: restriction endonuclease [Bacteroidales bacterium]|nr:restriction endonuclease [Bacteroidales bacterium]